MDRYSLEENVRHGTVSFPMALYEYYGEHDDRVPLHWHNEMEYIFFKKGVFHVWLNTKEYLIQAPAIMCIHPEELHALTLPKKCQESAIVFNLNILSFEHYDAIQAKLIRPLMDGRLKMPLLIRNTDKIFEYMKVYFEKIELKMKEMNTCNKGNEKGMNVAYLQIKTLLLDMLAILYENDCFFKSKVIRDKDDYHIENLKKVISYMNENYSSTIRLDTLAELINMNTQYFCRYFKKNIGKTITEYLNEIRVDKAAEALVETNDKIIDIAQNIGFDNIGYFIRRFKNEKGMTPSEYRKTNKKSK